VPWTIADFWTTDMIGFQQQDADMDQSWVAYVADLKVKDWELNIDSIVIPIFGPDMGI